MTTKTTTLLILIISIYCTTIQRSRLSIRFYRNDSTFDISKQVTTEINPCSLIRSCYLLEFVNTYTAFKQSLTTSASVKFCKVFYVKRIDLVQLMLFAMYSDA